LKSTSSFTAGAALVGGLVVTSVFAAVTHADSLPAMAPGHWHRRTVMEIPAALKNKPGIAALIGQPFESDLCIGPNRAARGPVAVALADDGNDCRVLGGQIQGDRFSARRECRLSSGKGQLSILAGKFTATTIVFTSSAQAGGQTLTSNSAYAFVGPCRNTDIPAS
jgi:hypothetical protein